MGTALQRLKELPAAAWIAIVGLIASTAIYGWSFPRGLELGFDEGSHYLETERPWASPYFHTLYAWYAHGIWKLLGAKIVSMRWFALVAQLACAAWLAVAARGWLARSGWRTLPPVSVLVPLVMLWSVVCYTIGSIAVTYTSLSAWFSIMWLALVFHGDNREGKTSWSIIAGVWLLALLTCTTKPSTGAFLLGFAFLLTLGWRLPSRPLAARIQRVCICAALVVIVVCSSGLLRLKTGGDPWDLSMESSALMNFVTWAARYVSSDALRLTVVSLWKEPLREVMAALGHYACALGVMVGMMVASVGVRPRAWLGAVALGALIALGCGVVPALQIEFSGWKAFIIALVVTVACAGSVRTPSSRGAVVVGALGAQLAADAWGIIAPGETFFFGADHEFRVIFILLVAAMALLFVRREDLKFNSTANALLIVVIALVMPVLGWFGSGCQLGARAGYHFGVWVVFIVCGVAAVANEQQVRRWLCGLSLGMTLLAVNAIYVCRVPRPINASFPLLNEETKTVRVGPRSESMVFGAKTGGMISRVKSVLKEHGFEKEGPIFAFYDFPGLVFLVGGTSPGATWYMSPGYEHPSSGVGVLAYNTRNILVAPEAEARRAFVFQVDGETSFTSALQQRGLRFPDDYDHCATVNIPAAINGRRKLDIWKPRAKLAAP